MYPFQNKNFPFFLDTKKATRETCLRWRPFPVLCPCEGLCQSAYPIVVRYESIGFLTLKSTDPRGKAAFSNPLASAGQSNRKPSGKRPKRIFRVSGFQLALKKVQKIFLGKFCFHFDI